MNGFENKATPEIINVVCNIRDGFDNLLGMGEKIFESRGEKHAPPAASFLISKDLLAIMENELTTRGVVVNDLPGRNWTEIFKEIESVMV